ncbi:MAG: capsular biosynthesis protein [Muribaculaceae bacterium]|nr:capsular biosynthesis protein [Muribaculaceae bacterium]
MTDTTDNMKIALVLPGNRWICPYTAAYMEILDREGVPYDVIYWNRDGSEPGMGIEYDRPQDNSLSRIHKVGAFIGYIRFIKRTLLSGGYDKVLIFGPQIAIPLAGFLKKHFSGRYIFDYRDLSIEQIGLLKRPFRTVLDHSYANVISSPGFKKCLPQGYDYVLSHNFVIGNVRRALDEKNPEPWPAEGIDVLTIGSIRDYEANREVIDALRDRSDITMRFIGRGVSSEQLKEYATAEKITNIEFKGFYNKEDERGYIDDCTYLNIYYPRIISHSTALSNRFYNSLICKRPMIVTSDSTQGSYVERYNLGLSLNDCSGLDVKLKEWVNANDYRDFCRRCDNLLTEFVNDYNKFNHIVVSFIQQV